MESKTQQVQEKLDDRKSLILKTIVDSYIKSPTPISSKVVGQRCGLDVSSATIRNEMHELEEAGYLYHTHTSSGRVPSDLGYRYFVDNYIINSDVMDRSNVSDIFQVGQDLRTSSSKLEGVLQNAVQALSKLTSHTALLVREQKNSALISDVHTSLLADKRLVVAMILDDSTIERVVVDCSELVALGAVNEYESITDDLLKRWEIDLSTLISKHSISELASRELEITDSSRDVSIFLSVIFESIKHETRSKKADASVHLSGVAKIAESAAIEIEGHNEITTQLLALLEQHMEFADLVRSSVDKSITAKIGSENIRNEMNQHSLVLAPFVLSDGESGAVGIIGPKRMDYKSVFSHLNLASTSLNDKLD